MKYSVAIKFETVICRTVEAETEDDIYDAIDEARAGWDLYDVLTDMDEITHIYIIDENYNQRELVF